jgi:hypothetical protein
MLTYTTRPRTLLKSCFREAFCDISLRLGGIIPPFGLFSDTFPGPEILVHPVLPDAGLQLEPPFLQCVRTKPAIPNVIILCFVQRHKFRELAFTCPHLPESETVTPLFLYAPNKAAEKHVQSWRNCVIHQDEDRA